MNLNELYNENKNPFQDVVDKVAAKEKQADAEHTKGLKDIADKFQSAEKKSSEEFSKKLRADEAKDTHCSDKCCGSDVKAEDCNCPPTCKHCDCNAIVAEAQLPQQGVAEAELDEIDRRGFLKGLGAAAATAAVPAIAQAGSGIDYNRVQALHDQTFKKNPQYAKEWQAANGARVRAFIKSKDPKFRDRATARKARLDMTAKLLQKYNVKINESQFDPINDDDFYEYNVNTNKIVKRISGKHPIARQFSPMQKEWAGRDADHKIVKGIYAKQLKPTVDEKVSDYLPAPLVNKHSIVKGWRKAKGLDEKAPEILSRAVGAVSGAVSGIGGALIGNMFAPLIGSIAGGAAGAIGGYKVGSAITDAIWDDIAKLFGGEKKAIAAGVAHAKAAAAGEKSFEFNGKKYPVTLKPQEVGKAVAELKAVKEAYTMEKAPPGDKAERMVKHIKKNYSKDGKLTPTEKSIAYATAWKAHNAGKV